MIRYLLSFLLLFACHVAPASIIKGSIKDTKGAPVGFATLVEIGSGASVSANEDGKYEMELLPGEYEIQCYLMGYTSSTKKITVDKDTVTLDYVMETQQYELGEVVITNGEDPAYEKMRQVIAKRKYHADLVKALETDIYLKGLLRSRGMPKSILGIKLTDSAKADMGVDSNGQGILYLLEELSHYQYEAPNYEHNKVISVRESGDAQGLGFATMPPIINIYDNNLKILDGLNDRGFISPANSNAFLYYRFRFEGSYMENGKMINKIAVIPKRKYEPVFSGTVYVVEDEWVFQAADLMLTKESQMDVLDTLRLEQSYRCITRDNWVIEKQVLYPALKIFGFDIAGNFLTVYQNSRLNEIISNKQQDKHTIASYDSMANSHQVAYWDSMRPVPLMNEEVTDFLRKDSISIAVKNKADSLEKATIVNVSPGDWLLNGASYKKGNFKASLTPLVRMFHYNTVEGLNFSPGLNLRYHINKESSLQLFTTARYGFKNEHFNPKATLAYIKTDSTQSSKIFAIAISGGRNVQQLNTANPITPFMNDIYTLFGGRNYMKIYENSFARFFVQNNWGNGWVIKFSALYEDRKALYNTTHYTFSENNKQYITANQPAELPPFEDHCSFVTTLTLQYQPGWKYIQYPKRKVAVSGNAPVFTAEYTKGFAGVLDSRTDFDKWSIAIQHNLRMRLAGNVDYRIKAGGFLNKKYVGLPDMMHITGNRTLLANPYLQSFQLAPYYRFSNTADLYGEAHIDWHLGGLLTNKIPLFRRLQWHLVAGNNTLFVDKNKYYSEVYIGLENIGWKLFRFGRVDFIAGYESGNAKPALGIRIGLGEMLWQLIGIAGENAF